MPSSVAVAIRRFRNRIVSLNLSFVRSDVVLLLFFFFFNSKHVRVCNLHTVLWFSAYEAKYQH